jgi:hypothetical protein
MSPSFPDGGVLLRSAYVAQMSLLGYHYLKTFRGYSPVEKFKKILVLNNALEANLLETLLKEREIPYRMRSYHDSALDGLFQVTKGWGHVEAPEEFKEQIKAIHRDLPARDVEDQSSDQNSP